MLQSKELDLTGTTIFCSIDVHKKSWRVNIQDSDFELEDFSQAADKVLLVKHLDRKYPGATVIMCYEAGFSGFSAQRYFELQGKKCLIVNPADVATTDKEKRYKTDKIDARKLNHHLQSKKVTGIYIPTEAWEHGRSLTRGRTQLVCDQTRCKNRIHQMLNFSGLELAEKFEPTQYWSKGFVTALKKIPCKNESLRSLFDLYIKNYEQSKALVMEATLAIRKLCQEPLYKVKADLLKTIPGIGETNAAIMLFELQDIKRFKHLEKLCSYAGLVPETHSSGATEIIKGITGRGNNFLRVALVESAWAVVRRDPALNMIFKNSNKGKDKNTKIIKVARSLLSRINYILKNEKPYVIGVVK
jgi:transposase